MRPGYFKYCFGGIGGKALLVVISLFLAIYVAGFFMPAVDNAIEGRILGILFAVVLSVFFIGNYVAWRKL